jgi:segregation and condensation protein B
MEYFGINDLAELPTPKEFTNEANTIGESAELKDSELKEPDAQA